MLTNSRDIIRRMKSEGWVLDRIKGSHHVFKNPANGDMLIIMHPKKDIKIGLVHSLYRQLGWEKK